MVRLLHFADLHLDRSFAGLGMASSEAGRRREELRAALRRIVDLAIERGVDALTVGGDLYEHERVSRDTARFIAAQFERFGKPVLVAPGNHDPFVPESAYRQNDWPANVRIFQSMRWEQCSVGGLTVWGAGHHGPAVRENLLRELKVDASEPSVALVHASDMSSVPERKVAHCPFDAADVYASGARFVLLGHYHGMRLSPKESPRYGYPGSPEPLGFDEEGDHYALLLTVDGTHVDVEPLRTNEVAYRTSQVDVSAYGSSDEVRAAVVRLAGDAEQSPEIVRAVLVGQAEPELRLNVDTLLAATADRFRYLELEDRTQAAFDLAQIGEEATTRGQFVRLMGERIAAAQDSQRPQLEHALHYGLQAFVRQEVRPRAAHQD